MQTLLFNELFDTPYEFLFEEHNALYEALVHLERHLQSSEKLSAANCELIHPETICIQEGVRIAKHVQIEGPCFIGSGTEIRPGAYIRGGCFIGKDCVIGASSEVKHSILLDGVHLAHHNYVGDSIIGNNVNLSSAVTCANLRLDRASIKIRFEGRRIDTGLTKLGAIIGDGAFLGCHALCNPGAVIAKNARVQPKAIVSGYLAH
jgi:UDP-N-acetylglucosamine diphosphorylase / glucose-1-phosphate thymidylyltransferase / UDP-N-acetylgalactosamine diphosphorylase / glucosamine-1-phosphate N-acetyltransferase / galactosamine-1-phosphate N-acetyltransferase